MMAEASGRLAASFGMIGLPGAVRMSGGAGPGGQSARIVITVPGVLAGPLLLLALAPGCCGLPRPADADSSDQRAYLLDGRLRGRRLAGDLLLNPGPDALAGRLG